MHRAPALGFIGLVIVNDLGNSVHVRVFESLESLGMLWWMPLRQIN